jgi:hypothetical protein
VLSTFYTGKSVAKFKRIATKNSAAIFCSYHDGTLGSILPIPTTAFFHLKQVEKTIPGFLPPPLLGDHLNFRYTPVQIQNFEKKNSARGKSDHLGGLGSGGGPLAFNLMDSAMPLLSPWEGHPGTSTQEEKREEEGEDRGDTFVDGDYVNLFLELEQGVGEQIGRSLGVPVDTLKRYLLEFTTNNN